MRLQTSLDDNQKLIKDLQTKFNGAAYVRLKQTILALMFTQIISRFESETDYKGNKWAALKDEQFVRRNRKIKDKKKKGQIKILQDNGVLRQSLTEQGAPFQETSLSGNEVILGSNVEYSRIHNEGGVILHPGTDNGFGRGIRIAPHAITMPQRQFTGFSSQDEAEIAELVDSYLVGVDG